MPVFAREKYFSYISEARSRILDIWLQQERKLKPIWEKTDGNSKVLKQILQKNTLISSCQPAPKLQSFIIWKHIFCAKKILKLGTKFGRKLVSSWKETNLGVTRNPDGHTAKIHYCGVKILPKIFQVWCYLWISKFHFRISNFHLWRKNWHEQNFQKTSKQRKNRRFSEVWPSFFEFWTTQNARL